MSRRTNPRSSRRRPDPYTSVSSHIDFAFGAILWQQLAERVGVQWRLSRCVYPRGPNCRDAQTLPCAAWMVEAANATPLVVSEKLGHRLIQFGAKFGEAAQFGGGLFTFRRSLKGEAEPGPIGESRFVAF